MVGANDGVVSPMTGLSTTFNTRRSLAQGPAVGDLPPAVPTSGGPLFLPLTTRLLPQVDALALVVVHMLAKRLVARAVGIDLSGRNYESYRRAYQW